jgi:phosphoenolpyruvate---glycerone phosphotransferase subunit DhaL
MDEQPLARLIEAMNATISSHAAQLDALDEAIGDGDHGTNLARGFAALAAERARLGAMPLGQGLREAGAVLEREVGGDGGRYYGLFCRAMGDATPERFPDPAGLAAMLDAGVAAVRAEGGAGKGDKTLLDVLIPVAQSLRLQVSEGRTDQLGARILAAAAHGLHSTTHMQAKHGLAADLGVASVNRLDPGACSCALLFGAAVGALEPSQEAA